MRRLPIALTVMAAVLGVPATAAGDETLARISHPGPVSTFDGRVLWSEYDPVAKAYFLTQRFDTTTARLPVRPRGVPFDVDVGRNLGNDTVAAYSRCRREPRGRDPRTGSALTQMPQWSTGRGCDLYLLNLRTNVETSNTWGVLDGDLDTFMLAELARVATAGGERANGADADGKGE